MQTYLECHHFFLVKEAKIRQNGRIQCYLISSGLHKKHVLASFAPFLLWHFVTELFFSRRYGMNTSCCRAKTLVEYFGEDFGDEKCLLYVMLLLRFCMVVICNFILGFLYDSSCYLKGKILRRSIYTDLDKNELINVYVCNLLNFKQGELLCTKW